MPISFLNLPEDIRAFFLRHLSKMAPLYLERRADHPLGGRFDYDDLRSPVQVFTIAIFSSQRESVSFNPVEHGWLVFVGETLPSRTAEMAIIENSEPRRMVFLGLSSGQQIDDLRKQIKVLQHEPSLDEVVSVCRLLRVQALNLATIWLKAADSQDDLFLPLAPVWSPFEQKLYRASEFVDILGKAENKKARNAKVLFRREPQR